MKLIYFPVPLILILSGCNNTGIIQSKPAEKKAAIDTVDRTNNFYDNADSYTLVIPEITIDGEVTNPGKVDLSTLPIRSVFVKETLLDSIGGDRFVGAYRYDGYSLFDILDRTILKKVCLRGLDGYRCVLSYSELFNRNDQEEFLLIRTKPDEDGGLFRVFAACDFFSDRAVKSLAGIYLLNQE